MGVPLYSGLTVKRHGKCRARFVDSEEATRASKRFLRLTTARSWILRENRAVSLSKAYHRIAEARIKPAARIGSLRYYREEDLAKVDLRRRDAKLPWFKKNLAKMGLRQAEHTRYAAAA